MSHTPGPWNWTGPYMTGGYKINFDETASGVYIEPSGDRATTEANARLIAASPALYEALKALVMGPGLTGHEKWREECLRDAIQKGMAAIAAAEGK